MDYGLRHSFEGKASPPVHERKPFALRERVKGHGYSVQSAIQQSDGPPDLNRFAAEGESGDYRLTDEGAADGREPNQPAGYDLNGIGGEPIVTREQDTMGRVTRRAQPLMTHDGLDQKGSDYDHKGERGFKFRQKFDRV